MNLNEYQHLPVLFHPPFPDFYFIKNIFFVRLF